MPIALFISLNWAFQRRGTGAMWREGRLYLWRVYKVDKHHLRTLLFLCATKSDSLDIYLPH
jgi:hypothetical protein